MALQLFAQDNGTLPDKHHWCDAIYPYIKTRVVYKCPEAGTGDGHWSDATSDYRYNSWLSRGNLDAIAAPARVELFFDALGNKWNGSGGPELMDARHEGFPNVGFLDGHVKWAKALPPMEWEPVMIPPVFGPSQHPAD